MQVRLSSTEYERLCCFVAQWNRRNVLPATRSLTFVSDGKKVAVRFTNMQYWVEKPVPATADKKGICYVPATCTARGTTVTIRQHKGATLLNGQPVNTDGYEPIALSLSADKLQPQVRCYRNDLVGALRFVLPAMCRNSGDQRIYGVRIRTDQPQQLLLEATDTHRLHRKWIPARLLVPEDTPPLTLYATPDLLVLLQQLTGTIVSLGKHGDTAYLVSDRDELIYWEHELAFPNTERVIPDPQNATTTLRVSTYALRSAVKTLGHLKKARSAKTYVELQPNTMQITLTCAETKQSQSISLYSEPPAKHILFAIDRYLVEELLREIPSHTTLEITVYQREPAALTEWRIYNNSTRYALISGMTV